MTIGESRSEEIRRRFDALGLSDREWYRLSGMDIKTLDRATDPEHNTRESTYTAILAKLEEIEAAMAGRPSAVNLSLADADEGLIEFRISGNFGVTVAVKGPMHDRAEVEESALRLLREIQSEKPAE